MRAVRRPRYARKVIDSILTVRAGRGSSPPAWLFVAVELGGGEVCTLGYVSPAFYAAIAFLVLYSVWLVIANLPRRDRATSFADADHEGVVLYWRPGCK